MTQTPLQRAIEQLNSKITISKQDMEYYRKTAQMNSVRTEHDIQNGLLQSIQILSDLLPYEREVIEWAYSDGANDEAFGRLLGSVADISTDYFTKTFTNNGND